MPGGSPPRSGSSVGLPSVLEVVPSVDPGIRAAGNPVALAVLADDADPGGLLVLRVDQRDVRDVDRTLALDHAADRLRALGVEHLAWALVTLDHVEALDEDAVLRALDTQHAPRLPAVLPADHDHLVTAADLH